MRSKTNKVYIVNSIKCLDSIVDDNAVIYSESPYVLEYNENILDISLLLSDNKKNEICSLSDLLGTSTNNSLIDSFFSDYLVDDMYIFQPHRLFRNILIKLYFLQEINRKHEVKIEVIIDKQEECKITDTCAVERFGNIFSYIANFLDDDQYSCKVLSLYDDINKSIINDTVINNYILRLINLDYQVFKDALLNKINLFNNKYIILTYNKNETTREVKANLRNFDISYIEIDSLIKSLNVTEIIEIDQLKIKTTILKIIDKNIVIDDLESKLVILFKNILVELLVKVIISAKEKEYNFKKINKKLNKLKKHNKIILSHRMFGLDGFILTNILKKDKYKIIKAIHGVGVGISDLNDKYIKYNNDTIGADVLFTFSNTSQKLFTENFVNKSVYSIGAPSEIKIPKMKFLQKILIRNRYKLNNSHNVLFVSTLIVKNSNMLYSHDSLSEYETYNLEKKIIQEVSKTNKTLLYKPYPTKNYLDENLIINFSNSIKNCKLLGNEDFRYLRFTADIIVTLIPTSTIGWVWGSNQPIVYLDSSTKHVLSSNKIREIFNKAFFVFNYDNVDWDKELIEFLNKPYAEILKLWKEKEVYRKKYDEEYFLGLNKNAGKQGAKYIKGLIENE